MKLNSKNPSVLQDNHKTFIPKLIASLNTEDDWVIRSNIMGIFGACNIEPSRYLLREMSLEQQTQSESLQSQTQSHDQGQRSYDFDGVSRIVQLLDSKTQDVRESALNALMCMGPVAAEALPQVVDILSRDRHPFTRLAALRVIEEIGFPHVLSVVDVIQEVARKDTDKTVRRQAAQTLCNLRLSSDNSDLSEDVSDFGSSGNANGTNVLNGSQQTQTTFIPLQGNGLSMPSSLPQSARQAQQTLTVQVVRDAVGSYCKLTNSTSVNVADLTKYIDSCYPQLTRLTGGRWKIQLKVALRKMTSKGTLVKTPASYSLPIN